jgi:hypothetical protein
MERKNALEEFKISKKSMGYSLPQPVPNKSMR